MIFNAEFLLSRTKVLLKENYVTKILKTENIQILNCNNENKKIFLFKLPRREMKDAVTNVVLLK